MRLRVLGDGTEDNWVVIDERGEIVEGVQHIEITLERGKQPVGRVVFDGLGIDVIAEIRRLTGD